MKGGDRNKLCWCGSGKKYKKCHLDSDNQKEKFHFDSVINTHLMNFGKRRCCAKDTGLGACSGKIREVHPVSRDSGLSEISRSGNIIQYGLDFSAMKKKSDKILLKVKEKGIKFGSVFYGFCEKHDRSLFSCFENKGFTGRSDQCLEIACRNTSRELNCKNTGFYLRDLYSGVDQIISPENQRYYESYTNNCNLGNENERKNIKNIHDRLFRALAKKEYGILQSLIIKFDVLLPYMFTDAWSPYVDIYDRKLQDVLTTKRPKKVFMSSFTDKNCSYICMSWLDTDDAPGKIIAEQIKNLSPDKQSEIILLMALMNMINVAFNPDWFEALNYDQRKLLDALAVYPMGITGIIPSPLVNSNVTFDLPEVKDIFYSHSRR